jgi:hypothetical protein
MLNKLRGYAAWPEESRDGLNSIRMEDVKQKTFYEDRSSFQPNIAGKNRTKGTFEKDRRWTF